MLPSLPHFSTSTSLSSSLLLHLSKAFLSFVNSSFHILALNIFFIVDRFPFFFCCYKFFFSWILSLLLVSGQDNVSANYVVNIPNVFIATFVLFSFEYETISILISFVLLEIEFSLNLLLISLRLVANCTIGGHLRV